MPRKKAKEDTPILSRPVATTPEGRENQLIAAAYDLAEERILNKTASAQEITHFLKMGSMKERLEREILAEQQKLVKAKTESLESAKRVEEYYQKAIEAMKRYSGHGSEEMDYDEDE